jgi:dTDP-4-amino-4,6-dideoxygalactose transaminase
MVTYQESAHKRGVRFLPYGGLFEQDDVAACTSVIEAAAQPGGNFFPLPEESAFQHEFARHEGAAYAIAVNSCGTALDICMMALGIGPGDEVIVPPLTFICTATCASARGAKVIFADVDSKTLCLDPAAVEAKLTERTRAIIPVHFAGLACDLEAFKRISKESGVPVIYDSAHAVGSRRKGSHIGAAGKASCYSFQSNKNITTLGEGGAITTDDEAFAELARQKKTFGYVYGPALRVVTTGFNYRMTKPQLAVGLTQIRKADRIRMLRLERFRRLHEMLGGIKELILPHGIDEDHGCHLYIVRLDTTQVPFTRDQFRAELRNSFGVECAFHYPAVWSWEVFRSIDHDRSNCPVATEACEQVLSLPLFPSTPFEDLEYIAEALAGTIQRLKR